MNADKTYNGWANYETWNVALWLDNDAGSSDYWRERAEETYRDATAGEYTWQDRVFEATGTLADAIQSEHEENTPTVSGCYADLLNAALSSVDWREIAAHYIEDVSPEIDAEEKSEAWDEAIEENEENGPDNDAAWGLTSESAGDPA